MFCLPPIPPDPRDDAQGGDPRSPEARERARRQVLKHSMAAAGLVLPGDDGRAVLERTAQWHSSLRPWNLFEEWLTVQIAVASVQVERCQAEDALWRSRLARRAEGRWDEDRRLAAEELAEGLSRRPALVSRQLQETPQGCDWIIERWEALGRLNDDRGDWSGPQRTLALDLLGTPAELRDGPTRIDPATGQDVRAHRASIVAAEVARLEGSKATVLAELDAEERMAAEMGMGFDPPRRLTLLRRHEASCQRRLRWALDQFRRGRNARTRVETAPETVAPPPFDPQMLMDEQLLRDDSLFARIVEEDLARSSPSRESSGSTAAPSPSSPPASSGPSMDRLPTLNMPLSQMFTPPPAGNRQARRAQASQARR